MKVDLNQSFTKYCRRSLTILTFLFLLPQIALAQTWNAKTSIPLGGGWNKTDKAAALTWGGGDLIYAFQGNFQSFFFKYSISSNAWTALTNSVAGQQPGAGIAWAGGDFIFAIHGGNGTTFARYSISGNSWTTLTATPVLQGYGSSIVWTGGNELFVLFAAGFNAGDSAVYSYAISTGTWTLKTSIPQVSTKPFSGAALAWSGGDFIYALKGNGTNEFYRYSISGNSWTQMTNAPAAVGAATDAALGSNLRWNGGNFLYALPGNGSTAFWRYDIAGNSWTTLVALPAAVGGGGSIVYDNRAGQDFAYVLRGGVANDFYAASIPPTAVTIAFRSSSLVATSTWVNSFSINKPAGVVDGDVMVMTAATQDSNSSIVLNPPAGWTQVRMTYLGFTGGQVLYTWYKVASNEPASYTLTFPSGLFKLAVVGILAYSGVDTSNPIDAEGGQINLTGSTNVTAPSITTTVANTMLVGGFALNANNPAPSYTPPGGMTERVDLANPNVWVSLEVTDEARAVVGATGTRVAVATQSNSSIGHVLALKPASAPFFGVTDPRRSHRG